MKTIILVFTVALLLLGCSDDAITGDVVQEEFNTQKAALENKINSLEATGADLKAKWEGATTTASDLKQAIEELKETVAAKEKLLGQQLQVLRVMDDERAEAVIEADGCDERIEELETQVTVLQKWINVCEDEIGMELG